MTRHHKFGEVELLVNHAQPVMLTGEKGSGKTTIAMQVAEELDLTFYSMSMTRQTTLSHLLGYMSVDGTYIPSILHKAVNEGGIYLLDEIDAGDANVLLCLNTIENGYVASSDSGLFASQIKITKEEVDEFNWLTKDIGQTLFVEADSTIISEVLLGATITHTVYHFVKTKSIFIYARKYFLVQKYLKKGYSVGFHPAVTTSPFGVIYYAMKWLL